MMAVDNRLIVKGYSSHYTVNTLESKRKYLTYMKSRVEKYPTVYGPVIPMYEKDLSGEKTTWQLEWGCSEHPKQYLTTGFDPIGTYDYHRFSRHVLLDAIRQSLADNEGEIYFSKIDVKAEYKVGERYENKFNGATTIYYDVTFTSPEHFKAFINDKDLKPRFKQRGVLFDYLSLFWNLEDTSSMPRKIISKILERGTYLSKRENWYIGTGGYDVNVGEQLFTGESKTSVQRVVKWLSKDRKSQYTEDSFWDVSYISHQTPWEEGTYILSNFHYGMSFAKFKEKMKYYNVYYGIDFRTV